MNETDKKKRRERKNQKQHRLEEIIGCKTTAIIKTGTVVQIETIIRERK